MDVSQLYMAALRPTGAPIAGESADNLFFGQVELKEWSWDFANTEVKTRYEGIRKDREAADDKLITKRFENERLQLEQRYKSEDIERFRKALAEEDRKQEEAAAAGRDFDTAARSKARQALDEALERKLGAVDDMMAAASRKSLLEQRRDRDKQDLEERERKALSPEEKNFTFRFSKRVDVATTQLLNCMKAGELLPKVILTMHQASVNTPWSLVITVNRVRLIDYKIKVDTNDTMTDMLEDWECEFESFGYVYQNRPHAGIKSLTAGKESTVAARAASQGTVRVFTMTNTKFW